MLALFAEHDPLHSDEISDGLLVKRLRSHTPCGLVDGGEVGARLNRFHP